MHDPVTQYAEAVARGDMVAGPGVKAACARHLRDLADGPARGLHWELAKARRAIEFFPDMLRLADTGRPFDLQLWQQFVVGSLFGWLNADGYRRFQMAYLEIAKGNGKTPMAAGIGLYMLTADGELAAECYAAAVTRDQAQICFQDAVKMNRASPDLSERITESGKTQVFNLLHDASGSFFRPLSAEGRSLDGKRVHFAAIDEVHEHPTGIVVEKLTAGFKGRKQPLALLITNSGFDRTTVCFQYHEYGARVVAAEPGDKDFNDRFFAFICGLDEKEDPFTDESCWPKANPNLGVSVTVDYLRKQVAEARGMPAKASIVRRLNFCEWVGAENPWIDGNLWFKVTQAPPFDDSVFDGRACYAAVDLSGTRDLTALALGAEENGRLDAAVEFWTPRDTLVERAAEDRAPYDVWAEQGFVTPTPGRAVDYRFLAQRIVDLQQRVNLVALAFDPYKIKYLERELDELNASVVLVPHPQGFYRSAEKAGDDEKYNLWMPHSIDLLSTRIERGTINVRWNPCLNWNSASAVLETDAKENSIFTKRRSRGRIDGIVALAMLCGLIGGDGGVRSSVYEERGVLVF